MQFDFSVDVKKSNFTEADAETLNSKKVFENVMLSVIRAKYSSGIEGSKGRLFARLLYKVDDAENTTITLDRAEADFLRELLCDDSIRLEPSIYRIIEQYYQAIMKAE